MNRRTFLGSGATAVIAGLAGCRARQDNFNVVDVQVVKQATKVGVKVKVYNDQFAGGDAEVAVTLYNSEGNVVKTGCFEIGANGSSMGENTVWFEFGSVEETKSVYEANAAIHDCDPVSG